jgi:hypothetical protein
MGQVIDIAYARMIDELERLTANLLDDDQVTTSTEYLKTHLTALPMGLHEQAMHLVKRRRQQTSGDMKTEYYSMMTALGTWKKDFALPEVINRYRTGINPVRALYYEAVQVHKRYNRDDPYHSWLAEKLASDEFSELLINTLKTDVRSLEKFVAKHYSAYQESNIPVEMFHVMYTLEDYREYLAFFKTAVKSHPEARG